MGSSLHLFEGFGVEIEYGIVRRDDLTVMPVADKIIHAAAGAYQAEVACGALAWSNELALHVIELKTNGPCRDLNGLASIFHQHIRRINAFLAAQGGSLLGTGAHPFMDPFTEMRLWPHENNPIYESYHRIFDCRGHGWANLQSVHLNLPFSGDDEFGRLHAAVRLVLPLIPALTASTPVLDGKSTGFLDSRLEVYRHNQKKIPFLTGSVIPEQVFTREEYEQVILQRIYRDIRPHDPENILQCEWLNSRGAIPRFDRDALEIRIIDTQECPLADFAVLALIIATVKALVAEQWCSYQQQISWPAARLAEILQKTIKDAERAVIADKEFLRLFGYDKKEFCSAGRLWRFIMARVLPEESPHYGAGGENPLAIIVEQGPLARRILDELNHDFSRPALVALCERLVDCLESNKLFNPFRRKRDSAG